MISALTIKIGGAHLAGSGLKTQSALRAGAAARGAQRASGASPEDPPSPRARAALAPPAEPGAGGIASGGARPEASSPRPVREPAERREPSPRVCAELDFDRLYGEHFDFVWRSARRLGVREPWVDDVVQEIFLTVHRRLSGFEGRSSIKTWIFGITRRVVADHRKKALRRPTQPLRGEGPASGAVGPQEGAARHEAARLLHALLERMEASRREIFVLSELEQMSAPEIAEALGLNLNTVYSRIRVARRDFEAALERHRARDGRMRP